MVCASYKSLFATVALMAMDSTDGVGTCFAPWRNELVNFNTLKADVLLIGQTFSSFRTFEVRMGGVNIISVAAAANVKVSVGVQMNDLAAVDLEIEAVCKGYAENPQAVEAIYVGNECLKNKDFGTVSAEQLVKYINQVKACTGGAVPVGTVQRINEWMTASDIDLVASACDLRGSNIYPFFTPGTQTPIEKFKIQFDQLASKYDVNTIRVTETGWPSSGEVAFGNTPSLEVMQQYLNDFTEWSKGKSESFWFMMFDSTVSYTGAEYEKHFGVFTVDGKPKVVLPPMTPSGKTFDKLPLLNNSSLTTGDSTSTPVQQPIGLTPDVGGTGAGSPVQNTPVLETPVQNTPGVGTPVQNTSVVDTPVQNTPVAETPVQKTPVVDTPVQDTSSPNNPVQNSPGQDTPVQQDPPSVQNPPAQHDYAQNTPVGNPGANTPTGVQGDKKDCAI
ncbi:hypothetical protein CCR75_009290 [Bremia lactucae]|uniref:glucan endo-1,3-beta-D-glucosidase n=1 Tax=Bremia lactucae TaxID=4779 RepID=A0A976IDA4_BRELC|nr:hypothetical protein CCR75_009290 [Bremia lactucae]